MNVNLLSLAKDALGGDFPKLAGQFLGESQGATQSALSLLLPAVVGVIAKKGATQEGATGLMSLINGTSLDAGSTQNVTGLFGGGGAGINALVKAGAAGLVPALFGDKAGALANTLGSSSGIKPASATNLVAMVVPLVLSMLKKFIGDKGLNASSLASLLSAQGPHLQGALDSRITSALGYSDPASFLGGLSGPQAETARRAGAAVAGGAAATTAATKSGLMRWLPWLIGAAALLLIWNLMSGRSGTTEAPEPTAAVTTSAPNAGAPASAAVEVSLPAKVSFDVGSAVIGADGGRTIEAVGEMIRRDELEVSLTGYTDQTGDAAVNEALAKERATAVRDALKAAGVAEERMEMRPPMFIERGSAGGDAAARRVEINKQ